MSHHCSSIQEHTIQSTCGRAGWPGWAHSRHQPAASGWRVGPAPPSRRRHPRRRRVGHGFDGISTGRRSADASLIFIFFSSFFFEFVWIGFIGRSETGYPAGYSSTRKTHQGICSESSAPYDVPQFFLLFFFVYEGKIARLAPHRAYYCTNYCSIFGISSYLISPVGLTQLITNRIVSLLIEYNNMWFRFFSTFKLLYWQSDNG